MESRSAVYRSAEPEDAVLAYHTEAKELAASGYVPTAEDWSSEGDQHVLSVEYGYFPDQAPAVLASLASIVVPEVDAQLPAALPPAVPSDAAPAPLREPVEQPVPEQVPEPVPVAPAPIEEPVTVAPSQAEPLEPAPPTFAEPVAVAPPPVAPGDPAPAEIAEPVRVAPSRPSRNGARAQVEKPVRAAASPVATLVAPPLPIEKPVRATPPWAEASVLAPPPIEQPVRIPPSWAGPSGVPRPSLEPPVATQAPPQRSVRLLPLAVIAVLVIAGSLAATTGPFRGVGASSAPPAAGAGMPPIGTIWFGSSFDTTSNSLLGRSDSLPLGKPVAFEAHLNRPSNGEVVGLQLDVGGSPATLTGGHVVAGANLFGEVLPATTVFQAGTLTVQVVDVGGNLLSIGTVTILP